MCVFNVQIHSPGQFHHQVGALILLLLRFKNKQTKYFAAYNLHEFWIRVYPAENKESNDLGLERMAGLTRRCALVQSSLLERWIFPAWTATLLRFGCGVTGVTDSSRCHFKRSHLGGGGTGVSCGNLTLTDAKATLSSDNLTAISSRAGVKGRMSRLTHFFCLRSDGARALTPTPPSVTSASRVRLFPQYVRRIFPPLRCPLHWEPLEINNRKKGGFRQKRSGCQV